MGLLTDSKSRQRISSFLQRWKLPLCIILYLGGSIGFLAVSYQPLNNKTYFSENALLAGLVNHMFDLGTESKEYYRQIKEQVKENSKSMPVSWMVEQFSSHGLDVYVQNFSYRYPLDILGGKQVSGKNMYAILRAPKSASTEAIVISAPFRLTDDPRPQTNAGIALMMALAKYFRGNTYWAKDVIFLVTQQEEIGMQAWLNAYHMDKNSYISSTGLEARGGSIQAAINLELHSSNIDYFDLKINGLNGQLPNLDLVNVAVHLSEKGRIKATLNHQFDHYAPLSKDGIIQSLRTYVLQLWNQLTNTPTGNHGLFHKYRIEALTLVGIRTATGEHEKGFVAQGRVIEGIVRSLNNLMERFHQSFFFYLLPASHRYVSIGVYMGPFAAMASTLVILALCLWLETSTEEDERHDKQDGGPSGDKPVTSARKLDEKFKKSPPRPFYAALPLLLMTQIFAMAGYWAPQFFVWTSRALRLPSDEAFGLGSLALTLSSMLYPHLLHKRASSHGATTTSTPIGEWRILKCIALIHQGLVLFVISLMNISLAYCLALVTVPVSLLVRPHKTWFGRCVLLLLLVITCPITLVYGASIIQTLLTRPHLDNLQQLLIQSWDTYKDAILWSVVDWYLFGNWIYALMAAILFPNWLMFWGVMWAKP